MRRAAVLAAASLFVLPVLAACGPSRAASPPAAGALGASASPPAHTPPRASGPPAPPPGTLALPGQASGPWAKGSAKAAASWIRQHGHTVGTTTPVPGGEIILTGQPGWAFLVETATDAWVQLPLPLDHLSFERRTADGSYLFLAEGTNPVAPGDAIPAQFLAIPTGNPAHPFITYEGPAVFPLATPAVFGNPQPTVVLASLTVGPQGVTFGFAPPKGGFYQGGFFVPLTTVTFEKSKDALVLDLAKTTAGNLPGLASAAGAGVRGISVAPKGEGLEVALHLTPDRRYDGAVLAQDVGRRPGFRILLRARPLKPPWGP